jgi:hypothetical protein
MKGTRDDPKLQSLAHFVMDSKGHPDVIELKRRGDEILKEHASDLAALASRAQDDRDHRTELTRSAREVLATGLMTFGRRVAIGIYLIVLGIVGSVAAVILWSLAGTSTPGSPSPVATVLRWQISQTVLTQTALVAVFAVVGSTVIMTLTFANRAGRGTLENGYLWWYLTRPISAAGLGLCFYATVIAGFVTLTPQQDAPSVAIAATVGVLAGLFTDQLLKKLRAILGQTDFEKTAVDQAKT